jgi:hypothetical protein
LAQVCNMGLQSVAVNQNIIVDTKFLQQHTRSREDRSKSTLRSVRLLDRPVYLINRNVPVNLTL